jgi:amino acid adenylation domain-containing protein
MHPYYEYVTQMNYPKNKTIHQLFEEQATVSARKIALKYKTESLSYQELNQRSNQLARDLRTKGVTRNTIVGLMVERSLHMMVGIMAILKAGGAYLPIDPQYPGERINFVLEDSAINFLLLTRNQATTEIDFNGQRIYMDDPDLYQGDDSNLGNINTANDLVYVIYTSGSTGKPKGVMIEHQAVHNFIVGVTNIINFDPYKTIISLTTISFDMFVLESLLPLTRGLTIIIVDPRLLYRDAGANRIDMLQTTPSTVQLILKEPQNIHYIRDLSEIMIGGEAFPPKLFHELKSLTNAKIYNMYGPTETTVWSTIKDLTQTDTISIGQPIANTQLYVLDNSLNPQPVGMTGELFISGDGVARGYLHRPELTNERFIADPFMPGQRMYRTGDLVRELANNDIEYIGRVDHQVKIRGFRIELGEIEANLIHFPGIEECVVAAKTNNLGESYLVAYYISQSDLNVSDMIAYLGKKLPEYMIPGFYIRLAHFPLTPNGKLDRNALIEPDHSRPNLNTEYIAPEDAIEKTIIDIWQKHLNIALIGIHDNFFDLGGNSVLLSSMYAELNELYPEKLEVADIFAYPTVAKLTKVIEPEQHTLERLKSYDIHPLVNPSEHETDGISEEVSNTLRFKLIDDDYQRLRQLSVEHDIKIEEIVLTVYMYLLSELTGQLEITVQTMIDNPNLCLPITLNFSNTDFIVLAHQIKEQRCKNDDSYPRTELTQIRSNMKLKAMIPFYCNQRLNRDNSIGEYGILLQYKETSFEIEFLVVYNDNKLRETQIMELIVNLLKIIKLIIQSSQTC